jgi:hypothetical protein
MKLTTLKTSLQTLKPSRPGIGSNLSAAQETQRLRGSAAVKRRASFLTEHPYCAECEMEGRVTPSTVPDHRQPLWAGGADDLISNGQALCAVHHGKKTKCEARMRAGGGWMATACFCRQH